VAQALTREHPLLTCDSRSLSKECALGNGLAFKEVFLNVGMGVESTFRAFAALFSRPPEMQGWSPMDRVVDAPVYQDIPTWKRGTGLLGCPLKRASKSFSQAPYFCYESLR
jgi:hypothetical protein